VGVSVGPNNRPGPQAERNTLITSTQVAAAFDFMLLLRDNRRTWRLLK
jgi:hypothetical protein